MRATRDGSFTPGSKAFKLLMMLATTMTVCSISKVSSMPQKPTSNILFPSQSVQHNSKAPATTNNFRPLTPIITSNGSPSNNVINSNNINANNGYDGETPSEFVVGNTGIACNNPGGWAPAPDGCNSCFCAENGQLGSVCTRAFCPPGFPSASHSQFKVQ